MEDSLFVKTGGVLVLFLAFKYQISGKNKKQNVQIWDAFTARQIRLLKLLAMEWGNYGYCYHSNIYADHSIFVTTTAVNNILTHFLDAISL